jgi:hypothetical protein
MSQEWNVATPKSGWGAETQLTSRGGATVRIRGLREDRCPWSNLPRLDRLAFAAISRNCAHSAGFIFVDSFRK